MKIDSLKKALKDPALFHKKVKTAGTLVSPNLLRKEYEIACEIDVIKSKIKIYNNSKEMGDIPQHLITEYKSLMEELIAIQRSQPYEKSKSR